MYGLPPSALISCTESLDAPDRRREPILERERLAPIPSEVAVLARFEESEIRPSDEEPELNKHVGGGTEDEDEDVRDEEVYTG